MDDFSWTFTNGIWVAYNGSNLVSLGAVYCSYGKFSFKIGDSLERSMISFATPLEGITTLDEAKATVKVIILLSLKQTGSEES